MAEKSLEILRKIESNTRPSQGFSMLLTSNTTDFNTTLTNSLHLHTDHWSVGLHSFSSYFSFFTVTSANNVFKYFNGAVWRTLNLASGSYSIIDINDQVKLGVETYGDDGTAFTIDANNINGGSVIEISAANYEIDFSVASSIGTMLGFGGVIMTAAYNMSPNKAVIINLTQILVNCSVIKNSYLSGREQQVLYSFPPDYMPYSLIAEKPLKIVYLPINANSISAIRIWLTDQDGTPISLNGETVTLRINFKSD
jgi:hypothetical protein